MSKAPGNVHTVTVGKSRFHEHLSLVYLYIFSIYLFVYVTACSPSLAPMLPLVILAIAAWIEEIKFFRVTLISQSGLV